MTQLPMRSEKLVDAAPVRRVRTGSRTVVELTASPNDRANIGVGELDTAVRTQTRYVRVDLLPLNDRAELERSLDAILDRPFDEGAVGDGPAS